MLLSTGFQVTITEPETGQSVTITDGGAGDATAATGTITYNTPAVSPFTDFAISGLTVISSSPGNALFANLTQGGTVARTTSTGGQRTLVITATDDGFTAPMNLMSMTSSTSTTFTDCVTNLNPPPTTSASNYTSAFQSTVTQLSPVSSVTLPLASAPLSATLASSGTPTNSSPTSNLETPLALSANFALTNVYTLEFDPATAVTTSMLVNGATKVFSFTPPGLQKSASVASVAAGGQVTYTYTLSNPNPFPVSVDLYDDFGIPGNPQTKINLSGTDHHTGRHRSDARHRHFHAPRQHACCKRAARRAGQPDPGD